MTRQQMFNTAYHGLVAQGFERSMSNDGKACRYRGEGGRRCALGYLIPDADYRPEWDSLIVSATNLAHLNINSAICESNTEFLKDLQDAHDMSSKPAIMRRHLAHVATKYGLTIPELPDFSAETQEASRELALT